MEPRARYLGYALLALALCSLGASCRGFKTIVIDSPIEAALFDEDPVATSTRVSAQIDPLTVEVRLGGVDLIGALGLTPPFDNQSGVVTIGSELVTITNFSYTAAGNPRFVTFEAAGLASGPQLLEVEGLNASLALVQRDRGFTLVDFFTQEASALPAAAQGPEPVGSGELVHASFGQPLAAAPVAYGDGSELRAGFVEAAEALIRGN